MMDANMYLSRLPYSGALLYSCCLQISEWYHTFIHHNPNHTPFLYISTLHSILGPEPAYTNAGSFTYDPQKTCTPTPRPPTPTSAPTEQDLFPFFENTDGYHWVQSDNWLDYDVPLNDWYGVGATGNNILILDLQSNSLKGKRCCMTHSIPFETIQMKLVYIRQAFSKHCLLPC
jgi:hypothetical protein